MAMADTRDDHIFLVLAQNLREQRKKKSLSQEQLADLANLDRTYISLIETGKRNPSLSTISDLASILEITIQDLLLEPIQLQTPIMRFCVEYSINPEFLVEILRDPKVIPMIRGKAFEFLVKDKLEQILQKSLYSVSNPFLNPQSGTDKADVKIRREADEKVFLVECKLAQKGEFKVLPKQNGYRVRVKCMRSRTLGEEAAARMAVKTGRSMTEHYVHSDQYLPTEFDFVVTSIANAFYETDNDGAFIWSPPEGTDLFFESLGIRSAHHAYEKVFVARSQDLAANTGNQVLCSRKTCDNKSACGFIPNYPYMFFDHLAQVQPPWYPLEQIERLLRHDQLE
jgi:transcriptional regulator with XRE-family HTH domain